MMHLVGLPWEINRNGYARCRQGMDTLLHCIVMPCAPTHIVDHRDRNRLNCQRHNLRVVTRRVNDYNRKPQGVSFDVHTEQWRVRFGGKTISRHDDAGEAWLAAARARVERLGTDAPPWAIQLLKGELCVNDLLLVSKKLEQGKERQLELASACLLGSSTPSPLAPAPTSSPSTSTSASNTRATASQGSLSI